MDWTKQTEDMVKTWAETQKKVWDSWLKAVQQPSSQAQTGEMWQKTIDTWEETVKHTLETQSEWFQTWVQGLDTLDTEVPKEVQVWAKQAQEMMKRWTEAQEQLWQGWFKLVKEAGLVKMPGGWEEESQKLFQFWQESTKKMIDAQMQWANMVFPAGQQKTRAESKK
jgi:hypothetical protein